MQCLVDSAMRGLPEGLYPRAFTRTGDRSILRSGDVREVEPSRQDLLFLVLRVLRVCYAI